MHCTNQPPRNKSTKDYTGNYNRAHTPNASKKFLKKHMKQILWWERIENSPSSMLFHRLRTKCKICRKKSMLCRRFDCQINLNLSVAECEWRFRCQLLIMLDVSKSIWSITLHIAWLKYKAGLHCDKSYATQNMRTQNIRSRRVQYGPGICFLYSAIKCGKSEFLKTKPTILTARWDEHAQCLCC